MFNIYRITILSFALLTTVIFTGCDDDSNPVDDNNTSEHLHAVGVKLVQNSQDIIVAETADSTDVVGLIEIDEGIEQHFEVWFLNDENEWYYPGENVGNYPDHSMEIVLGNGDVLESDVEGWEVHLTGLHEGDSWIRIKVLHEGHSDYISPHLRTTVHHSEGAHGAPVGMYLKQNEEVIITANASNEISGEIIIPNNSSETFTVWFFDEYGVEFQPEDDHFLSVEILNDQVITSSVSSWDIELSGISSGTTMLSVTLMHGEHSHYSSPEITAMVE